MKNDTESKKNRIEELIKKEEQAKKARETISNLNQTIGKLQGQIPEKKFDDKMVRTKFSDH